MGGQVGNFKRHSFNFTGSSSTIILNPGVYNFSLWGAAGGGAKLSPSYFAGGFGGKGGYTEGIIKLLKRTKFYIFVGGAGEPHPKTCQNTYELYTSSKGGFNGGGDIWSSGAGGAGGGATDIRINNDQLVDRIIVAGGGGGGGFLCVGGDGGGLIGGKGKFLPELRSHQSSLGVGGNQNSGGGISDCSLGYCIETNTEYVMSGFPNSEGSFGRGGNAIGRLCGGGSGGGGWYGGGGTYNAGGGGGGSSYISSLFLETNISQGINEGNGKCIITVLSSINSCARHYSTLKLYIIVISSLSFLLSF